MQFIKKIRNIIIYSMGLNSNIDEDRNELFLVSCFYRKQEYAQVI